MNTPVPKPKYPRRKRLRLRDYQLRDWFELFVGSIEISGCVAIVGWAFLWSDAIVEGWPLFVVAAMLGGLFAMVLTIAGALLGPSRDRAKVSAWVKYILLPLGCLVWFAIALNDVNRWLDTSPPTHHRTYVTEIRPAPKGRPFLLVNAWPPHHGSISVGNAKDERRDDVLVVTTREGFFHWEWIESVERL